MKPSHAFYEKLWSDKSGFLPCYVEAWNTHKGMIKAMGDNNGFIDQLMNKIAPSVNGNYAMSGSGGGGFGATGTTYTEESYRTFVGRMKSWWNTRYTNFDGEVQKLSVTGTCPSAPPSSSSAARSSSSSVVVSSSSRGATPIAQNPLPVTRSEIPTYYTIKGEPVGSTRPAKPGVYLVKQGNSIRKIVVR